VKGRCVHVKLSAVSSESGSVMRMLSGKTHERSKGMETRLGDPSSHLLGHELSMDLCCANVPFLEQASH
jgi:hypothetical protein